MRLTIPLAQFLKKCEEKKLSFKHFSICYRVQRNELRMSSRIFVKFDMVLLGKSGAWEKMIQEKNLKQKKSRDTVP
jgi:hypothetical protein